MVKQIGREQLATDVGWFAAAAGGRSSQGTKWSLNAGGWNRRRGKEKKTKRIKNQETPQEKIKVVSVAVY